MSDLPKPDTLAAVTFLQTWPTYPVLTAIHTNPTTGEKGRIETRSFPPINGTTNWRAVHEWINARQGHANLYFSVNPPLLDVANPNKKMKRTDIAALVALHIDSDVWVNEDQETGIARILKTFQAFTPPPSTIVVSGGGAQAYWRLKPFLPINGDIIIAESAKLYNVTLERTLGGDDCHNIDRIMRLPGSINIPNTVKLKKGRKISLAYVVSDDANVVYDISKFTKAEGDSVTAPKVKATVKLKPGLRTILSDRCLTYLPADVQELIRNGYGTEQPGLVDRKIVGAAVRLGLSDAAIKHIWRASPLGKDVDEWPRGFDGDMDRLIAKAREDDPVPIVNANWGLDAEIYRNNRHPTLLRHADEFFSWIDCAYQNHEDAGIKASCREFLEQSFKKVAVKQGETIVYETKPCIPDKGDVGELLDAVKDHAYTKHCPPCWLSGNGPEPSECIALQNTILHVPTRNTLDPTPDFFTLNALDFNYDTLANCNLWLETLNDYWPDVDGVTAPEKLLLQEIFGYLLLPWTNLQKLFFFVGSTGRNGKGTIARVLKMLLGDTNGTSPTFSQLADPKFGREPLIGKLVAIVGEAGFGRNDDPTVVTDFLKALSGEDYQSIGRKFKANWEGTLPTRMVMMCNQIPEFADNSPAFAARLVALAFNKSFEDAPDINRTKRLSAELPGIFLWALAGYDRLRATGRFTLPPSSAVLVGDIERAAKPLFAFFEECCILDAPDTPKDDRSVVTEADVFARYEVWCETCKLRPMRKGKFIESLAVFSRYITKHRLDNGFGARGFRGFALRRMPQTQLVASEKNIPF